MRAPGMIRLDGVARHYAWGSRSAIPLLLGTEPDGSPVAELWFGAHPDAPSPAPEHGAALDELIAADPVGVLGADVAARFGGRLPFLAKILAADTALSIQVHPTLEQARAGFAAEDAHGIPRDAPQRNYRDQNHKPELLCALTPFEALCGFRPVEQTLAALDTLAVPELAELRTFLAGPDGLRAAFTFLLEHPNPAPLIAAVTARAADESGPELRPVALLAVDFPGDVGIVLSLLLNYIRLEPGEAIFLAAGNVHCYLRGTGVEVMANSDNVLRCALTSKHVDIAEVLAVADFAPLAEPRCPVDTDSFGTVFHAPAPDFRVTTIALDADQDSRVIDLPGPHLLLAVDDDVEVGVGEARVRAARGEAVLVAADSERRAFTVRGRGRVFCVAAGAPVR